MPRVHVCLTAVAALCAHVRAQVSSSTSCTLPSLSSSVPAPSVAPGYEVRLVATGLARPRGIAFDDNGNLLVVEQRAGLVALSLNDQGGSCIVESNRHTVINDTTLNHGLALSGDGRTLYVSSPENVTSFAYAPGNATVSGSASLHVANMTTDDHTTRTLLLSRFQEGALLVSRGSTSNIDPEAAELSSGHSQIKSFQITGSRSTTVQNFNLNGTRLGWGLRNDVGVAEHPTTGGIWSVENSADEIVRNGVDVHQNNPAEELNYLGTLVNNTSRNQGGNFGYPQCFTAWNRTELPDNGSIQVGQQFALAQNASANDTACRDNYIAPRLAFQAHMAPLDIKFNTNGSEAWIAFHGSWDRQPPSGYKVGVVQFTNGEPTEPSTSMRALFDVVANTNLSACPGRCFRPVALAFDRRGRLFFSSDSTGEIYVITRTGSTNGSVTAPAPSGTTTGSGAGGGPSSTAGTPTGASSPAGTGAASAGVRMERAVLLIGVLSVLFFVAA